MNWQATARTTSAAVFVLEQITANQSISTHSRPQNPFNPQTYASVFLSQIDFLMLSQQMLALRTKFYFFRTSKSLRDKHVNLSWRRWMSWDRAQSCSMMKISIRPVTGVLHSKYLSQYTSPHLHPLQSSVVLLCLMMMLLLLLLMMLAFSRAQPLSKSSHHELDRVLTREYCDSFDAAVNFPFFPFAPFAYLYTQKWFFSFFLLTIYTHPHTEMKSRREKRN
jgi:hypothetical protein